MQSIYLIFPIVVLLDVLSIQSGLSYTFISNVTDPVSELITDAVASTVLPDITTVAVRANMVEDALCIGSLAVNVTFIVSPDFASVAFELLEDISNCCFAGDVLSTRTFDEVRSDCVSVRELPA